MARTPRPTALKVLHGSREDRINRNEPVPASALVEKPAWLLENVAACQVWDRLAPDLMAKGVLTAWDVDAFADLCAVIIVNRDALQDIARHGTSVTSPDRVLSDGTVVLRLQKNPAWQVARESTAIITTLGGRFGLNPSDRAQLHVKGDEDAGPGAERLLS